MFGPSKRVKQSIEETLTPGDSLILASSGRWIPSQPNIPGAEGAVHYFAVTEQGLLAYQQQLTMTKFGSTANTIGARFFAQSRDVVRAVLADDGHTVFIRDTNEQDVATVEFGALRKTDAAKFVQAVNS